MNRTTPFADGEPRSILEWALAYHRRGWSIIPIGRRTKKPPKSFRWKRFQERQPAEDELRDWFADREDLGLAVIFGPVSQDLCCRDFDQQEAYDRWAAAHPDLARTLPTVATARGRHVYFTANLEGIQKFADGELRAKGYCVLPPSVHPSRATYRWLLNLPTGEVPRIDPVKAGFFLAAHVTERTEDNGRLRKQGLVTCLDGFQSPVPLSLPRSENNKFSQEVMNAIHESLPLVVGNRNRQVFDLARALKAIPGLADADPAELEPIVRLWHTTGLSHGVIGSEPFEETLIDFVISWPKVKFPKGQEPMTAIVERAKRADLPAIADRYESDGVRLLLAICRELQLASGDHPFFLACRTAGRLLGVSHMQAWRWLFLLQTHKVIEPVGEADRRRRKAQRYRYIGE